MDLIIIILDMLRYIILGVVIIAHVFQIDDLQKRVDKLEGKE